MSSERARLRLRSGLEVGLGEERDEEEVDEDAAELTRGRISCKELYQSLTSGSPGNRN